MVVSELRNVNLAAHGGSGEANLWNGGRDTTFS